ncbi:hypothetical protein C8R45DRAFT_178229 [Mycena sanguinolenta]|nr:hypothetical protein C8R45DRAFT_178229 [Mycena sanguinolenta]
MLTMQSHSTYFTPNFFAIKQRSVLCDSREYLMYEHGELFVSVSHLSPTALPILFIFVAGIYTRHWLALRLLQLPIQLDNRADSINHNLLERHPLNPEVLFCLGDIELCLRTLHDSVCRLASDQRGRLSFSAGKRRWRMSTSSSEVCNEIAPTMM